MATTGLDPAYELVLRALRQSALRGRALREEAMRLLDGLPGFDWCGVYGLHGDYLHLDAYVGAATDHTVIPVGRGVCGTAVAEDKNQVVEDVRDLSNYLACSLSTRSEIVVLIKDGDKTLGQIDIDGHTVGRFGRPEEAFLEAVAEILAARWD
ncbi:MAG: GAF domain-containing protein [Fimbriimonadaceae bacterium]|nr:GAF domain-containing protein [Fimbriimonadaceae bacterium]